VTLLSSSALKKSRISQQKTIKKWCFFYFEFCKNWLKLTEYLTLRNCVRHIFNRKIFKNQIHVWFGSHLKFCPPSWKNHVSLRKTQKLYHFCEKNYTYIDKAQNFFFDVYLTVGNFFWRLFDSRIIMLNWKLIKSTSHNQNSTCPKQNFACIKQKCCLPQAKMLKLNAT